MDLLCFKCLHSSKILMLDFNPQDDSIKMWGLRDTVATGMGVWLLQTKEKVIVK